jgi:N,N'-diacetyllegionaminate synthase
MLKKLELTYNDFVELKKYCDKIDIMFLSTPHSSFEDIDFLNDL